MPHFRSLVSALAPCALFMGCATSKPFDRSTEPGGQRLSTTTSGAVILTDRVLSTYPGLTVLEAIKRNMPQIQISGYTTNHCPMVLLRGQDTVVGSSDPDVYVDGTRTVDTCPLVTLAANAAGRIEIYPSGVTTRPGYPSTGHGLILIFLQRADSSGGAG
jgi:hypothetical protein